MKKILIVTSYSGNNCGSSLQAFALKEHLKSLGFASSFIKIKETKANKFRIFFIRLMTGLTDFHLLKKQFKSKFSKHSNNFLINSEDTFESDYLNIIEVNRKELKKIAYSDEVSYCIVGSDQVWNPEDAYLDPNIFLKFSPKLKNVAYAASFGQNYIYKYNIKKFKKGLRNIRKISCREESGCILCQKLGFQSTETLDPTLLFNKDEWASFFDLNKSFDGRLLVLYFIGPIDNNIRNKIKYLAKKFDKAVLLTKYNQTIEGVETLNATVVDFLNYFYNASFVITDSFHGTIFAINFGVPFYSVSRVYLNADGDNNERVLNILKKISLQNRLIDYSKFNNITDPEEIDYSKTKLIMNVLREKSKNFICDALNISTK